jgi:hypothetical protein
MDGHRILNYGRPDIDATLRGNALMVEGQQVALEANDASVWVRRDGKWLCAMHTESLAGDPFGRDRRR